MKTYHIECISVFDIFKIGVGPSSSHTMGPWRAALKMLLDAKKKELFHQIVGVDVLLYGSLAKTGKGHGTNIAVTMGLLGFEPVSVDAASVKPTFNLVKETKQLKLLGEHVIGFDPAVNIHFLQEQLPYHPNALRFKVTLKNGEEFSSTFYSVGGGFIVEEGQVKDLKEELIAKYPVQTAAELMYWTNELNWSVSQVTRFNEERWQSPIRVHEKLMELWSVMLDCVYKGCHADGVLPGGLNVKRRACEMNTKLMHGKTYNDRTAWLKQIKKIDPPFREALKWISCFALAVNEENAAMGRVVTAPTNGAAGVIPSVMLYYYCFTEEEVKEEDIAKFILVAGELGSMFKKGATISAAQGGCQAEIGVSSAMAAGALTECLGGTPEQVVMAAEIAMEHHLGMTCDPIGGLVQIPCIERNSMGAIKAITASQIALDSDPKQAKVSLDEVIDTMWQTALDMNEQYKETSEGGLAAKIPVNVSEC